MAGLDGQLRADLQAAAFGELLDWWEAVEHDFGDDGRRWLGRNDRFYLFVVLLNRPDAWKSWLYARCREVEASPDDHLDLWAREHYKSSLITFSGIIQEILVDPDITIGVFSHTKGVARKFLQQVKFELESNDELKRLYPDVLFQNPQKESPKWSLDAGIVVRRASNPKEATVEGHGLVDGMPTGAHFRLRVYDDVVTPESVTTPDQIRKTTDAWSLSDNLGAVTVLSDGREVMRRWHIGTRYSYADTYQHILDKQILKTRIHPATDDGTIHGRPVFLSPEIWAHKLKTQTERDIACQQLQNPVAGSQAMFKKSHLRFSDIRPSVLNIYILVDGASSKKKGSDSTAMAVIGIDANYNKWLMDGYRQKFNLRERWLAMRGLRQKWLNAPGVQTVAVGYERYGLLSDLEYFQEQMEIERNSWDIIELNWPRDGTESKYDRIQRLYPDFSQGRFWLPAVTDGVTKAQQKMIDQGQPYRVFLPVRRKDHEGNIYTINKALLEEYLVYPFAAHDDFMDACSRIYDVDPKPPVLIDARELEPVEYVDGS